MLRTIARLYRNYKPFAYFGILAFILAALGVGFFIPVMIDFVRTGQVLKFPTLIVCGFSILGAIQSFFAGMILQNIVQKNRQDFEMELLRIQEVYNGLKDKK